MVGVVVVDGTGTDTFIAPNDEQYEADYSNSACRRIAQRFNGLYQRGPFVDGSNMRAVIDEAYTRAIGVAKEFGKGCSGLCLIGHSRGGAALIAVAWRLKQKNIRVGYMGLLDAVEMDFDFGWDVDCIPGNVERVRHAERSFATLSRPWWGNCGDAWENGPVNPRILWGTHGCIGGVPPGRPPDMTNPDPKSYIREAFNPVPTRVTVEQGWKAADDAWHYIVEGLVHAMTILEANPHPPVDGAPPPPRGGGGNAPAPGEPSRGGGGGGKTHIVKKGEYLSLIAKQYYGDELLWPVIHDANQPPCGSNPNLIEPNWRLTIPSINGKSKAELEKIRERGRRS